MKITPHGVTTNEVCRVSDSVFVPCDVFPCTTDELEILHRDGSPWIEHILQEVLWL